MDNCYIITYFFVNLWFIVLRDKGKCAAEEQQRTEEGTHTAQEATPKAPARAVSTVITIFRMVFQSVFIGFEF